METPASQSEPIWSTSHRRLIRTALLTLALLMPFARTEAATQYTFNGFDAPLDGVTSTLISGVEYKTGVMVGQYTDVYGNTHGWRGNSTKATMVPLLPLAGVNRAKWTVGSFRPTPTFGAPPSDLHQGFLHKPAALIPITIPGCTDVHAQAVNDAGEVVGRCDNGDLFSHAWHWRDGVVTPLDIEEWMGPDGCRATGINNAGVVVGSCTDNGFINDHGVVTVFNGPPELPLLYIYPHGINDKGAIFGTACDEAGIFPEGVLCGGFLRKQGVMSFVFYPGAQHSSVTAVHPSNGRIWGNWQDGSDVWHAFTATPTKGASPISEEVASR
jgi:probable HAF family extracellular repeat protein